MHPPAVNSGRILLLLDDRENRDVLAEWLRPLYEVVLPQGGKELECAFDLCILDGRALTRLAAALEARKKAEVPVFLPFLLITRRQTFKMLAGRLRRTLDEAVLTPIEKTELQARVESLLRTRRLSLELKLRSEDLEAFIHAMTHDLRAPLRVISGFAEILQEEEASRFDDRARHNLDRIQSAAQEMWDLIGSLVEFSRLGRKAIRLQSLAVGELVNRCVESMRHEIEARGGVVETANEMGAVQADPSLLKIAMTNLISNAVKFVAPGVRPCIRISAVEAGPQTRILVNDNGIGMKPEDAERIFNPFVRLHGVEDYPGAGLGLSGARKAVDIMGGRIGVDSTPGGGSTFWIELPSGGEA